jgi:hypothetical protein
VEHALRPAGQASRLALSYTLAGVSLGASAVIGLRPVSDLSPWLHLRIGQMLIEGIRFGTPDPLSSFTSRPYLPSEWLPAILGNRVFALMGLPGIVWMRYVGVLAVLTAVLWVTRHIADEVPALSCALGALAGASLGLTERPQLLGFVFLAVAIGAWWRSAEDLRPRWWLIPMTWFWASSHGLWIVGAGVGACILVGLAIDRRLTRHTAAQLGSLWLASLGVAGLTPLGPQLLALPFQVSGNVRAFVGEWQPTQATNPIAMITLAMIGCVLLLWIRSVSAPPAWQIALAALAGLSTLAMTRTIAVGALLAAPLLAHALQSHRGEPVTLPSRRVATTWFATMLCLAALAIPVAMAVGQTTDTVPAKLTSQLKALPPGTVVLDYGDLSGWLMWIAPQCRPVIDLRSEVYDAGYHIRYARAMQVLPGWDRFVQTSAASYALVQNDSAIAEALRSREGWTEVGVDNGYVLLRAKS